MCSTCSRFVLKSLSDDNQTDIIEAFNSNSRYLDDLLNIYNPYFESMVNQIYPPELQLKRLMLQIPKSPFWIYMYRFLIDITSAMILT